MKFPFFGVAKYKKAVLSACVVLCLTAILTACSGETLDDPTSSTPGGSVSTTNESSTTDTTPTAPAHYSIVCNGNAYTTNQEGLVAADGSVLTLIKGGIYRLSGERQGQIRVKVAKTEEVTLILDGLSITCANSAALYVESADRVYIDIPAGKTVTMTDAASYVFPDPLTDKPNACIYGSDDLTFRGEGTLIVNGQFNNGIGCKNDIVIEGGTIQVGAINNAIKGNGSVTITGNADVTVTKGEDGIKASSLTIDKGYVLIDGQAMVSVTCLDDALQAPAYITVADTARVIYQCEGNPANCDGVTNIADGAMIPADSAETP